MTGSKMEQLYAIMRDDPLVRKVVIAPSHAQGHLWLEHICRQYGAVPNAEVATMESWALERMRLTLARQGLRYVSPAETYWIVCMLLERLSRERAGQYLSGLPLTPGLAKAIRGALLELRECGIDADRLDPGQFEQRDKGAFLKELLLRYENRLRDAKLTDWGGLAREAEVLSSAGSRAAAGGASIVIADAAAVRSVADETLLARLSGDGCRLLGDGPSFTDGPEFPCADTDFFHASGALAEAREVRRRIVSLGLPLDRVEIVASDSALNTAALRTAMATGGIACTFADGLPSDASRIGRAAKLYLDWVESGFRLEPILAALKQSAIRLHDDGADGVSATLLIRELRQSGIGWGKERYVLLGALAAEEGLPEERANALRLLNRVFKALLARLEEETVAAPGRLVRELVSFLEAYGVVSDAGDHEALQRLKELRQAMNAAGSFRLSRELSLRYVREAVEEIRVWTAPLPAPGRVHVTSLAAGGMTGRPYTFVVGMSERNWAVSSRPNPILPDEERQRIHSQLPTGAETAMRRARERNERLGMIRGRCTMSYCSYEPAEQKEEMPAYELLQTFRRKTGRKAADYAELHEAMGEAAAFLRGPSGGASSLAADATELWIGAMQRQDGSLRRAERLLHAAYPRLRQGAAAAEARRAAADVTPYDGIVDTDCHPLPLPGERGDASAFSASMLERYGRCPLQYFFHYQLDVRAENAVQYDRTRWLDASRRGSLLHGVFERYLAAPRRASESEEKAVGGSKGTASWGQGAPQGDRELLDAIAEETIRHYAERIPAPSDHIFRKETDSIRRDIDVFFVSESRRGTRPLLTELQLHGDEAPLILQLGEGRTLPVKGFVDRVDEIAPHRYKIYDYKTGYPGKYNENECFAGGRQLQLPLYGLAAEQWMRERGYDPQAEVSESAYLFPTERGMGAEASRPQNRRQELAALLAAMTDGMRQGLFPPAADPKECSRCDYRDVCGSHAEQFAAKRGDARNAARLGPILEVGGYE